MPPEVPLSPPPSPDLFTFLEVGGPWAAAVAALAVAILSAIFAKRRADADREQVGSNHRETLEQVESNHQETLKQVESNHEQLVAQQQDSADRQLREEGFRMLRWAVDLAASDDPARSATGLELTGLVSVTFKDHLRPQDQVMVDDILGYFTRPNP